MASKSLLWRTALALAATLAVAPAWSDPRPTGSELRVNSSLEHKQYNPTGAMAPNGRTLIVWENSRLGIRGRYYGASGVPATAELSLVPNLRLSGTQTRGIETLRLDPVAAFLPGGEFFLAWTEQRENVSLDVIETREVLDRDVYIQRFTGNGQPIGQAARVNPASAGFQSYPRILLRGNLPALVVWQQDDRTTSESGDGIFLRYVTKAAGRPFGATFKVNELPGLAGRPAVAGLPNGKFIVVWHQEDGHGMGVFSRAFSLTPQGLPDQSAIQERINSATGGEQARPAVAARGAANYLVVWQGQGPTANEAHIFARFVSPAGDPAARIAQVSQVAGNTQISPSIHHFQNGNFLVTWIDWRQNAPLGIFGQTLDGQARLKGEPFQINEQPIGSHFRTSIAANDSTIFVPYEGYFNLINGITARRLLP